MNISIQLASQKNNSTPQMHTHTQKNSYLIYLAAAQQSKNICALCASVVNSFFMFF